MHEERDARTHYFESGGPLHIGKGVPAPLRCNLGLIKACEDCISEIGKLTATVITLMLFLSQGQLTCRNPAMWPSLVLRSPTSALSLGTHRACPAQPGQRPSYERTDPVVLRDPGLLPEVSTGFRSFRPFLKLASPAYSAC